MLWKLTPKDENADYIKLVTDLANGRPVDLSHYEVGQLGDTVLAFREDIEKYVLEHGFSSLIRSDTITEAVVAKGTPQSKVIQFLHKYLDKVGIDSELIIVDPFFYSRDPGGYVGMVEDVLRPFIPVLDEIVIITSGDPRNYKAAIQSAVENAIRAMKPGLKVTSKQTENYHDRFWISNAREKGVITGTSLNGFGNKYALIDRLNSSDVRSIVKALTDESLIA